MREVTHRYLDPLDAIWLSAASKIGLRVRRVSDAYASTDGRGELVIGARETLDADDSLAQMILHELCHSLVEGPESFDEPDWGLDNETDRDLVREHACLRLQAFLSDAYGLRRFFAATTEHRAFYEALPSDPLRGSDASSIAARIGAQRSHRDPWAPHLHAALSATATIARAAFDAGELFALTEPARPRHALGVALHHEPHRCDECAWFDRGRCRSLRGRTSAASAACERFEASFDCQECGACCREGYHAVPASPRDAIAREHPELVVREGRRLFVLRSGERCAALDGELGAYACRVYDARPKCCRDLALGSEHCHTARQRVGLSL